MNKKLNFISNIKKNYKIILYLLAFIVVIFSVYFLIPNFFNYTPELIKDSLKKNIIFILRIFQILNINLFHPQDLACLEAI